MPAPATTFHAPLNTQATSRKDSLVASPGSPSTTPAATGHQWVITTRWCLFCFSLNHACHTKHQRVFTTRWLLFSPLPWLHQPWPSYGQRVCRRRLCLSETSRGSFPFFRLICRNFDIDVSSSWRCFQTKLYGQARRNHLGTLVFWSTGYSKSTQNSGSWLNPSFSLSTSWTIS